MTNKHWFLVASQKEARIFVDVSGRRKRLELLKTIPNPLGEVKRGLLFHKQAGRGIRNVGSRGTVHYLDSLRSDPKEEAIVQFAREIAKFLDLELRRKSYKTLTIIAEPHFLGKLKPEMGDSVTESVTNWLHKDLQKTPPRKLAEFLIVDEAKA